MSYTAQQIIDKQEKLLADWSAQVASDEKHPLVYSGNVTGLSHHEYDRFKERIGSGTRLYAKADPTNKYDGNAVGIFIPTGGLRQIGWVPKALNAVVAKCMREKMPLDVEVTHHNLYHIDLQQRLFVRITGNRTAPAALTTSNSTSSKQPLHPTPSSLTKEVTTMSKISNVIDKNINLGTSAAFLEAGRIANNQISGIAGKKLPIMIRAYADTAMGRLLLANIASMAREHFRPNDQRLAKLTDAMTVSAYQEVLQNFDIEQMIDDMLSNSTIKKALKSIDAAEAKAE